MIFISHDIDELIQVCNCVTILRDGRYIATLREEEMEPGRMKSLMVGREVMDNFYRSDFDAFPADAPVSLEVRNISTGILKDVSFDLHKGEILGLASWRTPGTSWSAACGSWRRAACRFPERGRSPRPTGPSRPEWGSCPRTETRSPCSSL